MVQHNTNMKKIILSVSMLIAINTFGQANLDYIYNSPPEKVLLQRVDHVEAINTLEDMIGWVVEDVANGYITDTLVADTYIDNLEYLLFVLKNKLKRI